jgi:hypothetical protein
MKPTTEYDVVAFVDSDYAGDKGNRRSIIGYLISFAVSLSDVSNLINGLGSGVSVMFNGLPKEERDGICSAFGTVLVDLADGVCNISPERDGDNRDEATSLP